MTIQTSHLHITTDHDEIRRWSKRTTAHRREWRTRLCYPDPHVRGGTSAWFELVHRDIGDGVQS
ncbi:hypothetical protein SAMN04490220_8849 [Rhodococcus jostii]|uniref:Uncharacterized protein n=1 Tax=Rhodococcus jostii TaxID=132919 RepID=A0A1H5ME00_RHOJO|nr:hypothetical protein SAMN04490220_8849 [Rhodococcus jostii]